MKECLYSPSFGTLLLSCATVDHGGSVNLRHSDEIQQVLACLEGCMLDLDKPMDVRMRVPLLRMMNILINEADRLLGVQHPTATRLSGW